MVGRAEVKNEHNFEQLYEPHFFSLRDPNGTDWFFFIILFKSAAYRVKLGTRPLEMLHIFKKHNGFVTLIRVLNSHSASVVWEAISSCL